MMPKYLKISFKLYLLEVWNIEFQKKSWKNELTCQLKY